MNTKTQIFEIIGQSVSAISFVQDYVEIHFDEIIVRALAYPRICIDTEHFIFPESGSRDALCNLIGKSVLNVLVRERLDIELQFSGNAAVQIPLVERWRSGSEAAHYVPGANQPIEVW